MVANSILTPGSTVEQAYTVLTAAIAVADKAQKLELLVLSTHIDLLNESATAFLARSENDFHRAIRPWAPSDDECRRLVATTLPFHEDMRERIKRVNAALVDHSQARAALAEMASLFAQVAAVNQAESQAVSERV